MVSLPHMSRFKLFKVSVLKVVVSLVEVASQSCLGGTGGFLQAASGGGVVEENLEEGEDLFGSALVYQVGSANVVTVKG